MSLRTDKTQKTSIFERQIKIIIFYKLTYWSRAKHGDAIDI